MNAEECLHHRRRAADLVACQSPEPFLGEKLVAEALQHIAVILACGLERFRQIDGFAGKAPLGNQSRRSRKRLIVHDRIQS